MNKYCIRKATINDLSEIWEIIGQGQAFLKSQGLSQWQGNSALKVSDIENDIGKGEGYVFVDGEIIRGYGSLVGGIDPVYTAITEGQWENNGNQAYVSIHRIALGAAIRGKGLGKIFMTMIVDEARNLGYADIRIDTHSGNMIMQKIIDGLGFSYCGMVEFPFFDGRRKAYQMLNKKGKQDS